jgi:hypothetical protein
MHTQLPPRTILAIFISMLIALSLSVQSSEISVREKFDRFEVSIKTTVDADQNKSRNFIIIGNAYAEFQERKHKEILSDELLQPELNLYFMAAELAAFHTKDAAYSNEMIQYELALEKQGSISDRRIRSVYMALIGARRFDDAKTWRSSHGLIDVMAIPVIRNEQTFAGKAPSAYLISQDQRILTRIYTEIDNGPNVIVVGHPNCHFSRNAVSDIESDLELKKRFSTHVKWIAPQDDNLDFEVFQEWNRTHIDSQFSIVHRWSEWPLIESWETPNFYFFNEGKLVAHVVGWPREGRKTEILSALKKIGL